MIVKTRLVEIKIRVKVTKDVNDYDTFSNMSSWLKKDIKSFVDESDHFKVKKIKSKILYSYKD